MPKPDLNRIPPFYHAYVNQVRFDDLSKAFEQHQRNLTELLQSIPAEKWDYRYAEEKWTIKELVQHIIDAERIFAYRALTFARKDTNQLPGFDENSYAEVSKASRRSKDQLLNEVEAVQRSSVTLFQSFDNEQLEASGVANGNSVYVLGIGFIIIGHTLHHMNVLQERYL